MILILLCALFGWFARATFESIVRNKKTAAFESYQQNATEDLQKLQQQIHADLYKANEEFAKQHISRLLLEALKDITKENNDG